MRLFRYLSPDRVSCLKNEELCFSPPLRFNDPFDLRPVILPVTSRAFWEARAEEGHVEPDPRSLGLPRGKTRRVLNRLKREFVDRCLGNPENVTEQLHAEMLQVLNNTYGVLCFSTCKYSLLMWAHYARSHEGFVLEFDSEEGDFKQVGRLREVTYHTDRPILDPTKPPTFEPFLRKSLEWKYEQEFRIMRLLRRCERRSVNSVDCFFVHLPRCCVKAVYIGSRMDPARASEIAAIMAGTPAELYQTELRSRDFGLVFKRTK